MEINTGIIVSCMPTLPALIHDIRAQVSPTPRGKPKTLPEPHRNLPTTFHQPQSRSRFSRPTTITNTNTTEHKASSTSRSGKSCLKKKNSSHATPQRPQVRFFVGENSIGGGGVPFELDSTPVAVRRMEKAYVRGSPPPPQPPLRSHFSDYGSEGGEGEEEDWGWLS